ncbi:aminocyclopropanecarboxylate oxidase [Ranunculus cassubicifolius]
MEMPIIDLEGLNGDLSTETMELLHTACEKWGFFKVSNHGIDTALMEKVKMLVNLHYEEYMKESFYKSVVAKDFKSRDPVVEKDWESSFFIWHRPTSNVKEFPNFSEELCKAIEEYINQVVKLAEKLAGAMCKNLGLEEDYIKKAFSGPHGPSVGTKVAKYPQCPKPELVKGLRAHTDAGGIILLLQDDQVAGLEFFKDGKWVEIPPSTNNTIFINTGDQLEILSNGRYKSVVHRVMADENGSRLSIATFYNPAGDAIISPAPELLYPSNFSFQDYLKLYATTKFGDKNPRFETMKKMTRSA